jgi:multiple sugar transport system substrate-binding protein
MRDDKHLPVFGGPIVSRRLALRLGAGLGGAAVLAGCAPDVEDAQQQGQGGQGNLVWLSTQLQPVAEAEKVRNVLLKDFTARKVDFVPSEAGPFFDRISAEATAGKGTVSVIGGEHGDLAALAAQDRLTDLTSLVQELAGANINPAFLDLAKLGGGQVLYIPWMQATYVMAARKEALEHLQGGDPSALTYDQLLTWTKAIQSATGSRRFGLPAGEQGLLHRFFQGYGYPSFTGGLNTTFKNADAVAMWNWLKQAWATANQQSPTYGFMQEPLQAGEVWVAWDHVARLKDALTASPEDYLVFPAPTGPKGLGYMAVVAGLAIPKTAPDVEGAKELIKHMLKPETSALTLKEVTFFPPTAGAVQLPGDVSPGLKAMADAVSAQNGNPQAVESLLPVGLGEQNDPYNDVFRTTFDAIVLKNGNVQSSLDDGATKLQDLLDKAQAACWKPDPESSGTCKVG